MWLQQRTQDGFEVWISAIAISPSTKKAVWIVWVVSLWIVVKARKLSRDSISSFVDAFLWNDINVCTELAWKLFSSPFKKHSIKIIQPFKLSTILIPAFKLFPYGTMRWNLNLREENLQLFHAKWGTNTVIQFTASPFIEIMRPLCAYFQCEKFLQVKICNLF